MVGNCTVSYVVAEAVAPFASVNETLEVNEPSGIVTITVAEHLGSLDQEAARQEVNGLSGFGSMLEAPLQLVDGGGRQYGLELLADGAVIAAARTAEWAREDETDCPRGMTIGRAHV